MNIRSEYGVSRRNAAVGVGATDSVQPETISPSQRIDTALQPDDARSKITGVGDIEFVQSDSVQPSLNTPRVLQPKGVRTLRALDLDLNGSLDEVISRLSAVEMSTIV